MTTYGASRQGGERRGVAAAMLLVLCCTTAAFAQSPQAGPAAPAASSVYRPGDFLTLDLNRAALSPRPLGPETRFAPYGVEAKTETLPNTGGHTARLARTPAEQATAEHATAARSAEAKPRDRTTVHRLAVRRHRNPLDAQAFDARPQSWPCRGNSGICAWR
ncbi:hypothetical protein [Bradyrhizobium sp. 2TAF24]|uniref:hypothetical protein n=1 Tax=Bradyrhizobium sp. 2TAF24 TaxID=3233011 RepID=UPI003F91CCF4